MVLGLMAFLVVGVLGIKAFRDGWFIPAKPPPTGEPVLMVFIATKGCDCVMDIVHNAEDQMASWQAPAEAGIPVMQVDFYNQLALSRRYGVARAPALVLLDAWGEVVWKQDECLSDEVPFDLEAAEGQIRALVGGGE
jgi:hypothetical protein